MVQNQLQEKESEIKREISEYKGRLLQAEKEHQDALTEANRKVNQKIGGVVLGVFHSVLCILQNLLILLQNNLSLLTIFPESTYVHL